MIKELIVHYYQNWTKTKIKFAGYGKVNVFIGSSDQGKSVAAKVIKWVKDNRPSGTGFKNRKFKDKTTKAQIVVDNGKVSRVRGKTKNYYQINNNDPLKAVGRKVPPEVTNILQLEDINIQEQFEGFFLLQDSPGVVARKFNEFVGLSLIDDVYKESEKVVRAYNKEVNKHEEEINSLKKELEQYSSLKIVKPLLKKANKINSKIMEIISDFDSVFSLMIDWEKLKNKRDKIPDLSAIKILFDQSKEVKMKLLENETDMLNVSGLMGSLAGFKLRQEKLQNCNKISELLKNATQLQETLRISEDSILTVKQYTDSLNELSLKSERKANELIEFKLKLDSIHSKLKNCPTCGKKWKGN